MNTAKANSSASEFADTLTCFSEGNVLVDIFLRSYSLDSELPKGLHEKTRCVRIIQVLQDCLAVGPKRPLVTAIIPFEEIATVAISSESHREDEEEIDRMIEQECPAWERDFAVKLELKGDDWMKSQQSGSVQILNASNLREYVAMVKHAVVDVYAKWCQPCKEVSAILDELAQNYGNRVLIAKIDGDESNKLAEELDITAYPTVLLIEGGQVKKKIEGARSPEFYTKEIEILLGLRKREKRKNKTANVRVNVLSSETLVEYVDDSMASVIMFYEKGDNDCQLQSRAMHELAPKYRGQVLFAKAEASTERKIARLFEVRRTPEIFFVIDGDVLGQVDDRMTRAELRDAINEMLNGFG